MTDEKHPTCTKLFDLKSHIPSFYDKLDPECFIRICKFAHGPVRNIKKLKSLGPGKVLFSDKFAKTIDYTTLHICTNDDRILLEENFSITARTKLYQSDILDIRYIYYYLINLWAEIDDTKLSLFTDPFDYSIIPSSITWWQTHIPHHSKEKIQNILKQYQLLNLQHKHFNTILRSSRNKLEDLYLDIELGYQLAIHEQLTIGYNLFTLYQKNILNNSLENYDDWLDGSHFNSSLESIQLYYHLLIRKNISFNNDDIKDLAVPLHTIEDPRYRKVFTDLQRHVDIVKKQLESISDILTKKKTLFGIY
jgi:hypothetical protein